MTTVETDRTKNKTEKSEVLSTLLLEASNSQILTNIAGCTRLKSLFD